MKKIILPLLIIAMAGGILYAADIKATTEEGKKVILSEDGKWRYPEDAQAATQGNKGGVYNKSSSATQEFKGKKGFYSMWLNPSKWTILDKNLNQAAEFSFTHTSGEAYGMIIFERTRIPIDNLEQIVLQNALNAAPDAKITMSENRTVNGKEVRFVVIEGTVSGIPFMYNYYLYSGKFSAQVINFTSRELYDEFKEDFQEFMNGFSAY